MKIDELIRYYEWRLEQTKDFSDPHWEASERREHREFVERLETVISLLEELQWYREQDLIRKEDAIETILEAGEGTAIMYHEVTCNIIRSIPKAEPKYSGCSYDIFCEKIDCKGCEAEPKVEYRGNEDAE